MKQRTSKRSVPVEPDKVVVETYRDLRREVWREVQREPSVFNSSVSVRRYRVTVELIDEPVGVLAERVRKLWRTSEKNSHNWFPMQEAARRYGIELDMKECAVEYKKPGASAPKPKET